MRRTRARRAVAWALAVLAACWLSTLAAPLRAAGPPYPPPVTGQRVYDTAGVLSPQTIASAEATIATIETRSAAQVVVYTQVKPESDTAEAADADARALIDQWGIGRKGFDDSLVILLDLDSSLCHGQARLYAGSGFRAAFMTDAQRQAVFDNQMLPRLRSCDLDGAVLAALQAVDAATTPEHAAELDRARVLNALLGFGGLLAGFLLAGWWLWSWLRFGRDPVYLDDASIYMPAPPPKLTAATGALMMDGRSTRRALTTAMVDLASRGEIAFERVPGGFGQRDKVSIRITQPDENNAAQRLVRRAPTGPAERYAAERLQGLARAADGDTVADSDLLKFGESAGGFNDALEGGAVDAGWFGRKPGSIIRRWQWLGFGELAVAGLAVLGAFQLPSDGLTLAGTGIGGAGLITVLGAYWMPAVTQPGSMVRAWLFAYRRTLAKTLEQARSMTEVVESKALPWVETPDQAVVWGVALGLHREVEKVLERNADDEREGRATAGWYPAWYGSGAGASGGGGGGGLMAGSAIPSFGGMMAVLGTIGNTPSSSGGFGGGGSGGGGGAGGSF